MKKVLLAIVLIILATSPAVAFDLGGYFGPVIFQYQNWDVGTIYPANTNSSGLADGYADSFALLKVTVITDLSANVLWFQGKDGEYLEGWVYGINDNDVVLDAFGSGDIESVGGHVALYLHNVNNLLPTGGAPPAMPDVVNGLSAPADVWNATDGILFLSLDMVPGINFGDAVTTYHQDITTITNPTVGGGAGYLSVTGGSHAGMFDTNAFADVNPTADFFFQLQFDSRTLESSAQAVGWLVKSSGTATGEIIPEPASMVLLGIGLVGVARLRRRKR